MPRYIARYVDLAHVPRSSLRSLAIWVCEILGEAAGTVVCILVLGIIEYKPAFPGDHQLRALLGFAALKQYIGAGIFVLIEFALTGYLLTTALAAWFLARSEGVAYPLLSSGLYLFHSEIFFVAAGNRFFDVHNIPIQIGAAAVAFAVTLCGNHWRERDQRQ